MSLPGNKYYEIKAFKPHLSFNLGEVVVFKKDLKQKKMVIANFLTNGSRNNHKADYQCKYISVQGKPVAQSFQEKELIKIEQ